MANPVYATLDDLKKRIGIELDDTTYDGELQDALDAAHEAIRDDTGGRRFDLAASASERVFNPFGRVFRSPEGHALLTDDIGDLTGLIVEVGSGSSWSAITDYETGPDNAIDRGDAVTSLLRLIPWGFDRRSRVRITAKWGWPAVPAKIKQATLIKAQRLYSRKESPQGVAAWGDFGPVRVLRSDADYQDAISRYVLEGFGGPS